jgi:hypothetical protein
MLQIRQSSRTLFRFAKLRYPTCFFLLSIMDGTSPVTNSTPGENIREKSTPRNADHRSPPTSDTGVTDVIPRGNHEGNGKKVLVTRRSHHKSRLGCRNCKARRIKVCFTSKAEYILELYLPYFCSVTSEDHNVAIATNVRYVATMSRLLTKSHQEAKVVNLRGLHQANRTL